MKKTLLAAALLLSTGVASAAAITTLELTGGTFAMAGAGGTINPAAFADMSVDGSYDGSAPVAVGSEASYTATSVGTFAFGLFGPVAIYTAETDGVNSGFAAVSGDLTGTTLTLDLSSWTAYWNGTSFNQGDATPTITSYNPTTGAFQADWSALVVGGAFDGQTGVWSMTGTTDVAAVPVPAAAWLMGSGLLGLVGVARRKKAA